MPDIRNSEDPVLEELIGPQGPDLGAPFVDRFVTAVAERLRETWAITPRSNDTVAGDTPWNKEEAAFKTWDGSAPLTIEFPHHSPIRSVWLPKADKAHVTFYSGATASGVPLLPASSGSSQMVAIPPDHPVVTLVSDDVFAAPVPVYAMSRHNDPSNVESFSQALSAGVQVLAPTGQIVKGGSFTFSGPATQIVYAVTFPQKLQLTYFFSVADAFVGSGNSVDFAVDGIPLSRINETNPIASASPSREIRVVNNVSLVNSGAATPTVQWAFAGYLVPM